MTSTVQKLHFYRHVNLTASHIKINIPSEVETLGGYIANNNFGIARWNCSLYSTEYQNALKEVKLYIEKENFIMKRSKNEQHRKEGLQKLWTKYLPDEISMKNDIENNRLRKIKELDFQSERIDKTIQILLKTISDVFEVSIVLVTYVEEEQLKFKYSFGTTALSKRREGSICSKIVEKNDFVLIPNLSTGEDSFLETNDESFISSLLTKQIALLFKCLQATTPNLARLNLSRGNCFFVTV
jgi:hypothetical protein